MSAPDHTPDHTPAYMAEPWFALLQARAQVVPRSRVAAELGLSLPAVSQVLNASGLYGSGQASTTRIADKVAHIYGRYVCPHLTAEEGGAEQTVSADDCRIYAHRPAPVGSPRAMQHWQECRRCPHFAPSAPPVPKPVRPRKNKESDRA